LADDAKKRMVFRTGDLRHVKAGILALVEKFSDFSALFSIVVPLETTTKKASAPSYTVW
jgi:hypothetical protein